MDPRLNGVLVPWFDIIVRGNLGIQEDDKEVVILGRLVRWTTEGIEYEVDPKHRKIVLERLLLTSSKVWKRIGDSFLC